MTKKLDDALKEVKKVSLEREWEQERRLDLEGEIAKLRAQLRKARGLRPKPGDHIYL